MTPSARLADRLGLEHPPIAVSFDARHDPRDTTLPEPAGCCFWARAERARIMTETCDHAGCRVGSYVRGLVPQEAAAAGDDVAALVANEWVTPAELAAASTLGWRPEEFVYEPLAEASSPDVVLLRLTPVSHMTLQSAVSDLALVGKPQCQIVALAAAGRAAVSPGCAVSRVRTGLPAGELTAGLPTGQLENIVGRLEVSAKADDAVARYAARATAVRA